MTLASDGVVIDDFNQILTDFTRTISLSVVTKTTDAMTGEETSTYAAASNVSVVFFLEDLRYIWELAGLVAVGDAYVIAPATLGIKRYDKFTIDGATYIIDNVENRYVLQTLMQTYCTCLKA
jgi:hypothetical protein